MKSHPGRSLECLTEDQVRLYERDGYVLIEDRIPVSLLAACRAEIDRFREEARGAVRSTEMLDLERTHRPDAPRLRRIKLPHRFSEVFAALMRSDWILAPARDLIGPDLRLHGSKINIKAASYGASVDWHQDFAFYPHTNDDVLAVGVMLDDVTAENGPLMVFPGSHRGPIHDHHSQGVFSGTIRLAECGLDAANAVCLTGPAGSISLHHARLIHGSDTNRSTRDRSILFYELTAADAYPIMGAMVDFRSLAEYDEKLLCGRSTIEPRLVPVPVRIPLPQPPARGSIYEIQEHSASHGFESSSDELT